MVLLRAVSTIVNEVNEAIVSCLWKKCVASHLPATDDAFKKKMLDLEAVVIS